MLLVNKEDLPKEIIINLKKYKADEEFKTKCFVAHDYVEFVGGTFIEDIDGKGYWIKQNLQISINTMAQLLEKLKTSPHLQKEHYNQESYIYEEKIVQFQEWHLPKEIKGRREILFREKANKNWISVPEKNWSNDKLKILKGLR